jgi:hypothetical protein
MPLKKRLALLNPGKKRRDILTLHKGMSILQLYPSLPNTGRILFLRSGKAKKSFHGNSFIYDMKKTPLSLKGISYLSSWKYRYINLN